VSQLPDAAEAGAMDMAWCLPRLSPEHRATWDAIARRYPLPLAAWLDFAPALQMSDVAPSARRGYLMTEELLWWEIKRLLVERRKTLELNRLTEIERRATAVLTVQQGEPKQPRRRRLPELTEQEMTAWLGGFGEGWPTPEDFAVLVKGKFNRPAARKLLAAAKAAQKNRNQ
jgi:hypothetical protein